MSWPPTDTVAEVGLRCRRRYCQRGLAAPFGPSSAKISPRRISRLMLSSALKPSVGLRHDLTTDMIGDMRA